MKIWWMDKGTAQHSSLCSTFMHPEATHDAFSHSYRHHLNIHSKRCCWQSFAALKAQNKTIQILFNWINTSTGVVLSGQRDGRLPPAKQHWAPQDGLSITNPETPKNPPEKTTAVVLMGGKRQMGNKGRWAANTENRKWCEGRDRKLVINRKNVPSLEQR